MWQFSSLPTLRIITFYYHFAIFLVEGSVSLFKFVFPWSLLRLGILSFVKSFIASGICLVLSLHFSFRFIVFFLIICSSSLVSNLCNFYHLQRLHLVLLSFSYWECFYEVKFIDLLVFAFHIMLWKNSRIPRLYRYSPIFSGSVFNFHI